MNELDRKLYRYTQFYPLQSFLGRTWKLNLYVIKSNKDEELSNEYINSLVEMYLKELEHTCISEEFDYYRVGFAFLHFGNRGVDLTFWHYGSWGTTFEIYSCSWYCYGRNTSQMELLDSAEPVICQYEVGHFSKELSVLQKVIGKCGLCSSKESFVSQFIHEVEKRGIV